MPSSISNGVSSMPNLGTDMSNQMAQVELEKTMKQAQFHQMKIQGEAAVQAAIAAERNLAQSILNSMTEAAKGIRF